MSVRILIGSSLAWLGALAWVGATPSVAQALKPTQSDATPSQADVASRPTVACANRDAIGTSRVVQIDASKGPRYGNLQYKEIDFLKDKEVVLTFDDGPLRRNTRAVLDALASHCTHATFFMVGRMAISDPDMVKEVAKAGHSVGTHTWSHANLHSRSADRAIAEFELGLSAVQKAAAAPILPFFRFPYLADSKSMIGYLRARDVGMFSIDVDSYDYRTHSAAVVNRNVISQLASRGKGIILFHDIQPSTARGLMVLLSDLKSKGYKIVHLVAKAPVKTLPEYDAEADKLLARRNIAVAAKPLTTRAITWQMPEPEQDRVSKVSAAPTALRSSNAATSAPPASAPPVARQEKTVDWRRAIFER